RDQYAVQCPLVCGDLRNMLGPYAFQVVPRFDFLNGFLGFFGTHARCQDGSQYVTTGSERDMSAVEEALQLGFFEREPVTAALHLFNLCRCEENALRHEVEYVALFVEALLDVVGDTSFLRLPRVRLEIGDRDQVDEAGQPDVACQLVQLVMLCARVGDAN